MSDRATLTRTDQSAVVMTATTTGTSWLCDRYNTAVIQLTATSVSGTSPQLSVSAEGSQDNTNFAVLLREHTSSGTSLTFSSALTADGTVTATWSNIGKWFRPKYTVSGTGPSFTVTSIITFKT